MLITIDKTKELTRKEYVDFLKKAKGESITESRISQLVSTGKLKVRDYPELGNLQLIVLDDDEQALAQSRFATSEAIHSYSHKELGMFLGKLVRDLTNENGNATTLLGEKQAQLDKLIETIQQAETERDDALRTANQLATHQTALEEQNESLLTGMAQRAEKIAALQEEVNTLKERLADTQRKLNIETSFRSEFDAFKSLVLDLLDKKTGSATANVPPETGKPASARRVKQAKK